MGLQPVVVKIYKNARHYQRDVNRMARRGYTVQTADQQRGNVAIGKTAITTVATFGLAQLFGGKAHKRQRMTVTYVLVQQSGVGQPMAYPQQTYAQSTDNWSPSRRGLQMQPQVGGMPARPSSVGGKIPALLIVAVLIIAVVIVAAHL